MKSHTSIHYHEMKTGPRARYSGNGREHYVSITGRAETVAHTVLRPDGSVVTRQEFRERPDTIAFISVQQARELLESLTVALAVADAYEAEPFVEYVRRRA